MAIMYKISMENGETEDLTLNLGALMALSRKDKDLADRYFYLYKKMQGKNAEINELEMGEFIYIAYRCAHVKEEEFMEMEEFLYKLTDSRVEIGKVFQQLYGVQEKKQGFQNPSGKRHGKR